MTYLRSFAKLSEYAEKAEGKDGAPSAKLIIAAVVLLSRTAEYNGMPAGIIYDALVSAAKGNV